MITIPMQVSATSAVLPMAVNASAGTIGATLGARYIVQTFPNYEGATTFTPSDQEQIIQADGMVVRWNITINPIPSNYGKISWNGSVLTVS